MSLRETQEDTRLRRLFEGSFERPFMIPVPHEQIFSKNAGLIFISKSKEKSLNPGGNIIYQKSEISPGIVFGHETIKDTYQDLLEKESQRPR